MDGACTFLSLEKTKMSMAMSMMIEDVLQQQVFLVLIFESVRIIPPFQFGFVSNFD